MKALGYRGILDIGYRYDARDSSYKLLDANPRLGATFRLFVAENGMDVVRAQYLHFTEQPIPACSVSDGRKWIVEDEHLISCIRYYRDGELTLSDWLACYTGIQECAWFAADDIKPFLRMCSSFSVRPFRKIFREGKRLGQRDEISYALESIELRHRSFKRRRHHGVLVAVMGGSPSRRI